MERCRGTRCCVIPVGHGEGESNGQHPFAKSVGPFRFGVGRRHFRKAQQGEGGDDAVERKGNDRTGPGSREGDAREDENTATDDGADAHLACPKQTKGSLTSTQLHLASTQFILSPVGPDVSGPGFR